MITLIDAFVIIIIVGVSPWLAINLVGHYMVKGRYQPLDLHVSTRSSRYWYSGGFNIPAIVSWVVGVIVGLMFTGTSVYTGPFVSAVGGIDLSFTSAAIVGALLYFILSKLFLYDSKKLDNGLIQEV
jgi:purine-cytosine permease-like protein